MMELLSVFIHAGETSIYILTHKEMCAMPDHKFDWRTNCCIYCGNKPNTKATCHDHTNVTSFSHAKHKKELDDVIRSSIQNINSDSEYNS
jgi:hypothetical protein